MTPEPRMGAEAARNLSRRRAHEEDTTDTHLEREAVSFNAKA